MEIKIKRTIAILLAVCFLVSLTASAVSTRWGGWGSWGGWGGFSSHKVKAASVFGIASKITPATSFIGHSDSINFVTDSADKYTSKSVYAKDYWVA